LREEVIAMDRKDYALLAQAFKSARAQIGPKTSPYRVGINIALEEVCAALLRDNKFFNRELFIDMVINNTDEGMVE
jgi:hypothetical protein